MKKHLSIIAAAALGTLPILAQEAVPAFPGAEGYGRYTTGGRGGQVRHVTNLNDSGPGSFREATKGSTPKIIVFDVSGVIELKSDLTVGANTTIAGQTAPEGGITLRYYTIRPSENNIWRFIRIRRGQEVNVNDGADATWQRQKNNILLDHCSFSWSIDEIASYYDNRDFTMQWCSLTEALANAGHGKSEHSYGGIWGGKGASFHHNFLAHMQNRVPRFNGARYSWQGYDKTKYENTVQAERVDFRNCVMYNWGTGGCYGGPGGGYINMINNYYKAGPATKNKTRVTQVTVASSGNSDKNHPELYGLSSRYFIEGNYVSAASAPENYDWKGVVYDSGLVKIDGENYIKDPHGYFGEDGTNVVNNDINCVRLRLDSPFEVAAVTTHDATTAYEKVLKYCGASLDRDMVDVRNFEEAATGTATYTGSVTKLPGVIDIVADQGEYHVVSNTRDNLFDTDGDGIPDNWEIANGLNPSDPSDAALFTIDTEKGWYSNLEVYLNSLVEDIMKFGNADAAEGLDEYYPSYVQAGISDIFVDCDAQPTKIEYFTIDGRNLSQNSN
ncbi:MAG: pectate lyase, partial [Muribaculaceae bacterium]|nr:pectate lyase [Muribaculaceae bacterium]